METLLLGDQAKLGLSTEILKSGDPFVALNAGIGMTVYLKGVETKILMTPDQAKIIGKTLKQMAKEIKNEEYEIR